MAQKQNGDEIDEFIERFRNNPRRRPDLVRGLISGAGRLTLNLPRHGMARQIAEQLRQGRFSDYYEFEKLLARQLHPFMSGLNLNVVSDLQVSSLFSERYLPYDRDLNMVLASGEKMSPRSLKELIVKMTAAEGHYMVVKFYDLALRGIDAELCRLLKPVELAVMQMKNPPGDAGANDASQVKKIFRRFRDTKGADAARVLMDRMEWDQDLAASVPDLADEIDDGGTGAPDETEIMDEKTSADTDETRDYTDEEQDSEDDDMPRETPRAPENAITRYARMIRNDYLDAAGPDDIDKIRGIVKGIYIKNKKVYDSEKAADVVREVLDLWIADDSLDEGIRNILLDMADEGVDLHEENSIPENEMEMEREPLDEASSASTDNYHDPGEEEIASDGEEAPTMHDDVSAEVPADEDAMTSGNEAVLQEDGGVSGSELEALPDDVAAEIQVDEADVSSGKEAVQSEDDGVSGGELEALLAGVSDEVPAGAGETGQQEDAEDEFKPVRRENIGEEPDAFIVKDEILFEDKSLGKKALSAGTMRPRKVRVTMKDIADNEKRKNLVGLMELLAETDSAAEVSNYLVGSGVTPEVKAGVIELIRHDNFEDAFNYITDSENFDNNEKIILLEKWLKAAGMKQGWFEPPHDSGPALIRKTVESYVAGIVGAVDRAEKQQEPGRGHQEAAPDSPASADDISSIEPSTVEIPQKEMLKTGDGSIRLAQEIEEFQDLYIAGIDDAAVGDRLPVIQKFLDDLAAGEEAAMHFAVYYKKAFVRFLHFIDENSDLHDVLDLRAAISFCKKNKII